MKMKKARFLSDILLKCGQKFIGVSLKVLKKFRNQKLVLFIRNKWWLLQHGVAVAAHFLQSASRLSTVYRVHICFLHGGSSERGRPWWEDPLCQRWLLQWLIPLFTASILLAILLNHEKDLRNALRLWRPLLSLSPTPPPFPPSCFD